MLELAAGLPLGGFETKGGDELPEGERPIDGGMGGVTRGLGSITLVRETGGGMDEERVLDLNLPPVGFLPHCDT